MSASRDTTAIVWTRPDEQSPFATSSTFAVSPRFVNAIAYLRPTAEAPEGIAGYAGIKDLTLRLLPLTGYAVTGSQDAIINVYAIGSSSQDPVYTLLGHSNNVCSLDTTAGGIILSGSWDQLSDSGHTIGDVDGIADFAFLAELPASGRRSSLGTNSRAIRRRYWLSWPSMTRST